MKKHTILPFLAVLTFSCSGLLAESTNPQLLDGDMPAYTQNARAHGIQGTVVVEALVDESGRVFAADVVQSVNVELDALTVAAIKAWKFSPATEDGKAVMKVVRIPVDFNLIDPIKESVTNARDEAVASR